MNNVFRYMSSFIDAGIYLVDYTEDDATKASIATETLSDLYEICNLVEAKKRCDDSEKNVLSEVSDDIKQSLEVVNKEKTDKDKYRRGLQVLNRILTYL